MNQIVLLPPVILLQPEKCTELGVPIPRIGSTDRDLQLWISCRPALSIFKISELEREIDFIFLPHTEETVINMDAPLHEKW